MCVCVCFRGLSKIADFPCRGFLLQPPKSGHPQKRHPFVGKGSPALCQTRSCLARRNWQDEKHKSHSGGCPGIATGGKHDLLSHLAIRVGTDLGKIRLTGSILRASWNMRPANWVLGSLSVIPCIPFKVIDPLSLHRFCDIWHFPAASYATVFQENHHHYQLLCPWFPLWIPLDTARCRNGHNTAFVSKENGTLQ